MEIRIAGIANDSIVDGPGLRFTVFTQGCFHNCEGCHNPSTHDPNSGKLVKVDDLITQMRDNPLLDGLTISGGEPFLQSMACAELARAAHGLGLNVWVYTGFTYEQLIEGIRYSPEYGELLDQTDVLIDGPFILTQKSLEVPFRGSTNQRLIDVKMTKRNGRVTSYGRID